MASAVDSPVRSSAAEGRAPAAAENPFLSGVHRPMTQELTLTELAVTGQIPAALDGRYLRIGPNPIEADPAAYHWFTGDGMVHGLRLENGRALWCRNRWIRSNAVAAALGEAPAPGPRHGGFDTVNTNVVEIGGRTFALVEAGSTPVELSQDLAGQTYSDFQGTLAGGFTAHPHLDPRTGEQHAVCYEALNPTEVRHVVVGRDGRVRRQEPIPVQDGPMIHDCAITGRYAVIFDLPVTFSMADAMAGRGLPYRWNPDHPARVGLLPREGRATDIIWCEVEPAYVFHVANAYDLEDGRVVIDVCAYATMFDDQPQGPNGVCRGLERWTVDPAARRVTVATLDPAPQEFPRVDERRFGQPHRYVYAMALPATLAPEFVAATALFKHDLETGRRQVHDFGPQRYPGEFVFVPAAPGSAEDEGWLIGLVIDAASEATELVILDARAFDAEPVARIHIPHRIPPGFHGNWIPQANLTTELA